MEEAQLCTRLAAHPVWQGGAESTRAGAAEQPLTSLCFQMNGVMFLLVAKMSCSPGQKEAKKKSVL